MQDYTDDIEKLLWIELRFGITKTIGENPSNEKVEATENELLSLLNRYREELHITSPLPKVRIWLNNSKLNFMFFDRKNGKRILLGNWLANKETYYER